MNKKILFSLENCIKCLQTKEMFDDVSDVEMITFPHDMDEWSSEQREMASSYDVFEDLQKTAPILWSDGEKKIGYLRIRKWLEDIKK